MSHSAELDELEKSVDWVINTYLPQQKEWKKRSHEAGLHYFSLEETIKQYAAALSAFQEKDQ